MVCHSCFHGDTSPPVSHTYMMKVCLSLYVVQHMLSPQRAPERLMQLADSNLNSLVTEMNELLNRVRKNTLKHNLLYKLFTPTPDPPSTYPTNNTDIVF